MPDLNLIEEEEFEENIEQPSVSTPKKKPVSGRGRGGGGGGGKTVMLLFFIIIIAAGGVYFLNDRGIIKLWEKKSQPIVHQVEEDPFAFEQMEQMQKQADTAEVALLEAPLEEKQASLIESKKTDEKKKPAQAIEQEISSKLSEMVGDYTIQVIAYREKKSALETASNLEFAGYPSFVEKVPMKGGDWYTVRIGRYPSRDEAKKAVKTFAAQLQAHYVIDKVRQK